MKKLLFCLCFVVAISIALIGTFSMIGGDNHFSIRGSAGADSGFDAGYGDSDFGGGSSGGGDWSSSDSDYSGGIYIGDGDGKIFAIVIFVVVAIVIISLIVSSAIKRKKRFYGQTDGERKWFEHPHGTGLNDPLIQEIYKNYVDIQVAWMNRDMSPVKQLLSDEMFNMYEMQIETLKANNQINVMKNFDFHFGVVEQQKTEGSQESLKVIFSVFCKDYIIDESTKEVVSGNAKTKLRYVYELTFVRDIEAVEQRCPSCGSLVEKTAANGDKCKNCGNVLLNIKNSNYVLTSKKMIQQVKF